MTLVRLVTNPVTVDVDGFRLPRVARLPIPHASVIGDAMVGLPDDWCLSLCPTSGTVSVEGDDGAVEIFDVAALIDSDPDHITTVLLGEPDLEQVDFTAMLSQSANARGWTQEHMDWLAARITERGGNADDLDRDLPIYLLLGRLTELLDAMAADLLLLQVG